MSDPIRIFLISGSLRRPSYTRALTEAIDHALTSLGAVTRHWRLVEAPLPCADPEFHFDPLRSPVGKGREFVILTAASDAIVLATPVYHNSYSGVLKNALDHLAIPQVAYKPVGLTSHNCSRSTQALDHLRIVVRGLLGVAIPAQVCTAPEDYKPAGDNRYEVRSEEILERIDRFALELVLFTRQLRMLRQSLSEHLRTGHTWPGQRGPRVGDGGQGQAAHHSEPLPRDPT